MPNAEFSLNLAHASRVTRLTGRLTVSSSLGSIFPMIPKINNVSLSPKRCSTTFARSHRRKDSRGDHDHAGCIETSNIAEGLRSATHSEGCARPYKTFHFEPHVFTCQRTSIPASDITFAPNTRQVCPSNTGMKPVIRLNSHSGSIADLASLTFAGLRLSPLVSRRLELCKEPTVYSGEINVCLLVKLMLSSGGSCCFASLA